MKKRTCINGYGKYHQRQQELGRAAMQRGDEKSATTHISNLTTKANPIGGPRRPGIRGH